MLPAQAGYSGLYISPDGSFVVTTQKGPDISTIATDRVVVTEVKSGKTSVVNGVNGGNRVHSQDGRYMANVQAGWGKVQYFDLSDFRNPARLWEYDGGDMVSAADINEDGSMIALLVEQTPSTELPDSHIVILDREKNTIAVLPYERANGPRLMFVEDFLVVGQSRDPDYLFFIPTSRIDIYKIGNAH